MTAAAKSLATRFNELRTAHFAAGGQRKGLRYPERLQQAAVSYLRSTPGQNYRTVARDLGIGSAALKFWDSKMPQARRASEEKRPAFLPLEIVAPKPATSALASVVGHHTCRVTCREISIDLGTSVDEAIIKAVLAALQNGKGGATP